MEKLMKQESDSASFFINFLLVRENPNTPIKNQKRTKLMENRERNIQLIIRLNEVERALFEEKKKTAKCRNMSLFIRKCILEKEIYEVDLEPLRELQGLLSNATGSLNQIAKRVNSTEIIYRDDIEDMKQQIEGFSKELWQIHSLLLKRADKTGEK